MQEIIVDSFSKEQVAFADGWEAFEEGKTFSTIRSVPEHLRDTWEQGFTKAMEQNDAKSNT